MKKSLIAIAAVIIMGTSGLALAQMDMAGMQKNMMDMMKDCPMMKGMKGEMKEDSAKENTQPASTEEHVSHHPENK